VEAFGKLASGSKRTENSAERTGLEVTKMTREQVLDEIRKDYEVNNYFVSGQGEMTAYEPDCEFSDPFVSFKGVERFKENVSNLGSYLKDVKLDILEWKETETEVDVRWRFSCIVDLPWRPRLAAAGGTTHVLSPETGRVVRHVERWDVEVGRVLRSLLVPANRIPTSRWEVFMMSLSDGDLRGVWLAVSGFFVAPTAAVLLANSAVSLASGEDRLPAPVSLGCWLLLLAACVAELQKLTGVGKGNGGRGGGDGL